MSRALRVLVVDDERISRQVTVRQLQSAGYEADAVDNAYSALDCLATSRWDVVMTDLRMPGLDGIDLLHEIRARGAGVEVILMTAFGSVETAVAAMQGGAADYLTKPFSFAELDFRLRRIRQLRDSQEELARLREMLGAGEAPHGLLGSAPALDRARERIALFADSDAPVLVSGETGTGKELVARAIHAAGPRRGRPFVPVACGAIPRELAESELFGHEKGAFTGAVAQHRGCFERANGGTLLLDDVDDLPLELQVKLLRVLQDGTLRRVGGSVDLGTDVRVVATTKIGLEQAVALGRFRDDLFYRLRGLEIALPPLRQRGDDVLLLAQHFLEVHAAKLGQPPKSLTPEAAAVLRRHSWPGNVRELWRVVESATALCRDAEIRVSELPEFLVAGRHPDQPYVLHLEDQPVVRLAELVERFEDEIIDWGMRHASGQQARAAEILGIPRTTLQSKLQRRKG